jgi:hypothetical protein
MKKIALVLLGLGTSVFAAETNVYVELYTQRVLLSEAVLKRQEAETAFTKRRAERAKKLFDSKAMAAEEYERSLADHAKSVAGEDVAKAAIGEAKAMLEVAKSLVQAGQEVPLCRL